MHTHCKKTLNRWGDNIDLPKRFVFEKPEKPSAEVEAEPGAAKTEKLSDKYERAKEKIKNGVKYNKDMDATFTKLAALIDGQTKTKEAMQAAFIESFNKQSAGQDVQAFWTGMEDMCKKVTIQKNEKNKWVFRLYGDFDSDGKEDSMDLIQPDKAGLPIDTPPKKTPEKLETREEMKKAVEDLFQSFEGLDATTFKNRYPTYEDFEKDFNEKIKELGKKFPVGTINYKKYGLKIIKHEDGSCDVAMDDQYLHGIYDKKMEDAGNVRQVDLAAEEKVAKEQEAQEKGRALRKKLFGHEAPSGKVTFKNVEEYRNTKIADIYPDAEEGDRVEIRRAGTVTPITALYTEGKWVYMELKEGKWVPNEKKRITIEYNDDLTYHAFEAEEREVKGPEGIGTAGYYRMKGEYSWTDIARSIMYDGGRPRGEEFKIKEEPDQPNYKEGKKIYADSPQMKLEDLDYDYTEEADVKAYAELLKEYNKDPLYVWVIMPTERNPRVSSAAESQKKDAEMKKKASARSHGEAMGEAGMEGDIAKFYKNILLRDDDVKLKASMEDIMDNEDLWNYYWSKNLITGKEHIVRGFEKLGVPPEKVRKILYEAITEDNNDIIQFSELLNGCKDNNASIYKTVEGDDGSWEDFRREYYYFKSAYKKDNGQPLTENEQEWYDYYEDDSDFKKANVDQTWATLNQILEGSAIIMDGINNMSPTISAEQGKKELEAREERKEKEEKVSEGKRLERGAWIEATQSPKEDIFLQRFFHPANARAIEDITDEDEVEMGTNDFDNIFSEAEAYRMLKLKCASRENPNKIDRTRLVVELNALIAEALMRLKTLYLQAGDNKNLRLETEKLGKRYFGEPSTLEDMETKYHLKEGDFMAYATATGVFGVSPDMKINEANLNHIRNLLHDGFALQRLRAHGKIEAAEAPAPKEWRSYTDILGDTQNPLTRGLVLKMAEDKKFRDLPPERQKEIAKQIDQYLAEDHTFERKHVLDINAGVGVTKKEGQPAEVTALWVGVSTEIFNIEEIGLSMKLGVAVDPRSGNTMVGAVLGEKVKLDDQWTLNVTAGFGGSTGGVTPESAGPQLFGGIDVGVTWMSKGNPDDAWRTKVNFGAGFGSSITFNLTDVHLGPYIYVGAGEVKDYQNQYKLMYSQEYLRNRMDTVDQYNPDQIKEKAEAIRNLPHGIGEFMTEIQYNLLGKGKSQEESDKLLVEYYDTIVKKGLKDTVFKYIVEEETSGVTEYGVGASIDPVGLFMQIITLGIFFKLGFAVDTNILVKRRVANPTAEQLAFEKKMIADYEKTFGYKIEIEGERFADMDKAVSAEFAGGSGDMERIIGVPGGKKAARQEMTEFQPETTEEFKELQKQFAENKMELEIDPETKMYSIRPTMIESYRIYIDRGMARGNALILKPDRILIASGANLTDLFIKRFDSFYPGEVDGAVQHTVITISDSPYRKIGQIASGGAYIENRYDRDRGGFTGRKKVGSQYNVMTFEEFNKLPEAEKQKYFTSETKTAATVEREEKEAERSINLKLTGRALAVGVKLEENITLDGLQVSPEAFIKKPQYARRYRQLTTNATLESLAQLDQDIEKENPGITVDQKLLFKEHLFRLSMSEQQATVESRLQWAEKAVYVPYFKEKLEAVDHPPHITGERLARSFIGGVRQYLKENPVELKEGESIFTAVGTFSIEGIRRIYAATGQSKEENQFREGYDYSRFLTAGGEAVEEEQRYIAKILLETHSELPLEDERFVRSRLAKKLFYLGTPEVSNPLIEVLSRKNFIQLIKVYEAIEKGEPIPEGSTEALESFRRVCEKVRDAQVGNGIPVTIDGRGAYAVLIGNYYFVIETTIKSGYFEACRNPSSLYNEKIAVYKRNIVDQAPKQRIGQVAGAAADATILESRSADVWSFGFGVLGVATFDMNAAPETIIPPPEKERPPRLRIPPRKPAPVTGRKPGVNLGGGGKEGGTTEEPGAETETGGE